jgi:hypothetical protein
LVVVLVCVAVRLKFDKAALAVVMGSNSFGGKFQTELSNGTAALAANRLDLVVVACVPSGLAADPRYSTSIQMSSFITLGTPELSVPHSVTTTLVPVVLFQIARGSALYGSNHWAFADALILRDCFVRWDQPPRRRE